MFRVVSGCSNHGTPSWSAHCNEAFNEAATAELLHFETLLQDAQKGRSARPQRVKTGGVPSGAHGATNKEHHVCARRRVSKAAGAPLRI